MAVRELALPLCGGVTSLGSQRKGLQDQGDLQGKPGKKGSGSAGKEGVRRPLGVGLGDRGV